MPFLSQCNAALTGAIACDLAEMTGDQSCNEKHTICQITAHWLMPSVLVKLND